MAAWSWKSKNRQSTTSESVAEVVQITLTKKTDGKKSLAVELRAVGQALEKFKFTAFKLARQEGVYRISGSGSSDLETTFSLIRAIRDFVRGSRSESKASQSANLIEISYSRSEIDSLDSKERAQRKQADKMPDPYSVSQILRSVGTFLDNRHAAALLGISFQDQWVTVLYKNHDGRVEQEKQDLEYFYDFWVKMYLRRSNRAAPDQASEPTLYVDWEENGKSHTQSRLLH